MLHINPAIQLWCNTYSFEYREALITSGSACLRRIVVYHTPPTMHNKLTKGMFCSEFTDLREVNASSTGKLIIVGDFNFHWEDRDH